MMMLAREARQLADMLDAINKISSSLDDISFGPIPVYDVNGEALGYIHMDSSCSYIFTTDKPED